MDTNAPEILESHEGSTLELLNAIEEDGRLTQRGFATRIGIALGLANSVIKRATKKGLVKFRQAPAKRFAYYITPKGFNEKGRLVAKYLSTSLSFFRYAREEYEAIFVGLGHKPGRQVALMGGGELAEIAIISANAVGCDISTIVVEGSNQRKIMGIDVLASVRAAHEQGIDTIVMTETVKPQSVYEALSKEFDEERIFAPKLLMLRRKNGDEGAGE